MKRRNHLPGLAAGAGMLVLILDSRTALAGAQAGVMLCLKTVVPSLFPFFVLSGILVGAGAENFKIPRFLSKILPGMTDRIPALLLPAFLGGYPVGAQAVSQAWHGGSLSKEEAQRLLAFSGNAGPAFLFGMVGQMFPEIWMVWLLWLLHILGAVFAAKCLAGPSAHAAKPHIQQSASDPVGASVRTMGTVCGWIVLFRTILGFLDKWILCRVPEWSRVIVIGLLELSNGCLELTQIPDIALRFWICSCLLAAGGLCVSLQTRSVTRGLSLGFYALGKGLQLLVSFLFGAGLVLKNPAPLLVLLPVYLLCKKRYGKQVVSVV